MAYTVSGTLKLPDGTAAAGVDLRFVALTTYSPLIESAEQTVRTGANGSYSIALETSSYNVFVTYNNNRPFLAGRIVINSNTAPGQDLPTLLGGTYQPATPDWIRQVEAWLTQAQGSATAAASSASFATTEANRSRTEADRSKSEADRASQISGLSTVADAIGLAALPLPDVWAPLSDSLRMITGYGRDVLVGSDVVARMVNFSRNSTATYIGKDGQLKTAAANEPRFEREGLLIEGQSTNLTQRSEDWDFFNHVTGGATVKTATEQNPYGASSQIKSAVCAVANSNVSLVGAPYDMSTVKSLSVFFNIKAAPSGFFVYVASASDKVTISSAGEISSVASGLTATVKPVGGAGWRRLTISTGIAVSRFSFNLANVSDEIAFWGVQTEALPFASSYIPTAGAAVTRAADKAWLNVAGNLIPLSVIALEFNSIAPSSFYQTPNLTRYIVHTGDGTGITAYLGRFTTQFEDAGAAQGSTISQGRTVVVGGVSGGKAAIRSGAGLASGVAVKGFKQTEIYLCNSGAGPADRQAFGHVRNLRMYHRDLTTDQYKAVA